MARKVQCCLGCGADTKAKSGLCVDCQIAECHEDVEREEIKAEFTDMQICSREEGWPYQDDDAEQRARKGMGFRQ